MTNVPCLLKPAYFPSCYVPPPRFEACAHDGSSSLSLHPPTHPPIAPVLWRPQVPPGIITESNLHRARMVLADFGKCVGSTQINLSLDQAIFLLPRVFVLTQSSSFLMPSSCLHTLFRARHTQLINLPLATDSFLGFEGAELRPPEQILGLPTTPAHDTFQLGLIVWWMATGRYVPSYDRQDVNLDLS